MKYKALLGAALAGVIFAWIVGCDEGGDSVSGTGTIQGNVKSYLANGVRYNPSNQSGLCASIFDIFVNPAFAAVKGVIVRVKGTDLQTTTASDGSFIISGVPTGKQALELEYNGKKSTYEVTVEEDKKVVLSGITVAADGSVVVTSVQQVDLPASSTTSTKSKSDSSSETTTTTASSGGSAATGKMVMTVEVYQN